MRHATFAASSNLFAFLQIFSISFVYDSFQIHYVMKQKIIVSHLRSFSRLKLPRKIDPPLSLVSRQMKLTTQTRNYFLLRKCDVIKCSTCKRLRCIYSKGKLNYQDMVLIQLVKDENILTFGSSLFSQGHKQVTTILRKTSLSFQIFPMETVYYSTRNTTYPQKSIQYLQERYCKISKTAISD